MQITGTIINVLPTADGGYQSQNGYIFTYNMTIQGTDGQTYTGEIGAKTDLYPLGNGQQITVEFTNTQHGSRFKKVNPQYAGQPQQRGGQPNKGRDYDKENRGKCRFGLYQACIQQGCKPREMVNDKALLDAIEILIQWSMNGRPNPPPNNPQAGNPDWVGDEPPQTGPGDDVPF